MPQKPGKSRIPDLGEGGKGNHSVEVGADLVSVLKAGGYLAGAIAAFLGIAAQSGFGDGVVMFALGGLFVLLALALGVRAYSLAPKRGERTESRPSDSRQDNTDVRDVANDGLRASGDDPTTSSRS